MKKVLLIEDDDIVRENTAEILELANYQVETAKNGRIGIEKAKSFLPDIILCDIMMPELDGYGVLQIHSREPIISRIPFIFITAKTEHSDVRKGMNLGADDYILKPFQESELLSAIESRLKRREVFENKKINSSEYQSKSIDDLLTPEKLISYPKDYTIYCEGNNSKYLYLILKGEVKTYKITSDGKELITGIFKDGDYFGYSSFFIKSLHSEYAVCLSNSNIYKILKDEVIELIEGNHLYAFDFIERLSNNLKEFKEQLLHMAYGSVRKKTATTLLNLAKKSKIENEIKVSRSDLASITGIAKETLIRTLTDFKEEKLISTSRNVVKIINADKLKKIL
ncbi:MAG: response regulator [Flavobacteriaceae bacterium]|nr:response regulator [Flavobacteriaceae bacterium]